jgi:hypothetical protein
MRRSKARFLAKADPLLNLVFPGVPVKEQTVPLWRVLWTVSAALIPVIPFSPELG